MTTNDDTFTDWKWLTNVDKCHPHYANHLNRIREHCISQRLGLTGQLSYYTVNGTITGGSHASRTLNSGKGEGRWRLRMAAGTSEDGCCGAHECSWMPLWDECIIILVRWGLQLFFGWHPNDRSWLVTDDLFDLCINFICSIATHDG